MDMDAEVARSGRASGRTSSVATVVLPSLLTAAAFVLCARLGLLGEDPLWFLLSLLALAAVASVVSHRFVRRNARPIVLHAAIAAQTLAVGAIIYAIGSGPTLMIGFVFVVVRALDRAGPAAWRVALAWTVVAVIVGQVAIATDLVTSYVPAPYVHGLAVLGLLGTAFNTRVLGMKTADTERAFARRHEAEVDLRSSASLLSATLESTAEGIVVVNTENQITLVNSRFAQMWGIPDRAFALRDGGAAFACMVDQLACPDMLLATVDELSRNPEAESNDTLELEDGRVFERHSLPQRVAGETVGRVWSFRDVTDRYQLLRQLEHQAFHDGLTGLANRALMRDRLQHALVRSRRSPATVAVMFCDLDGFKVINDTLGHNAGDLLLVEVANRIRCNLRDGDTAARLGGDEFAIILEETCSRDEIALAERLLAALREPFVVNDREVFVPASIGISDNVTDSLDADELLCRADIAMYAAKTRGRDRYECFAPEMLAKIADRQELYGDLRGALQRDELLVHYQPLVDLEANAIESFEALVRWNHPTRGVLSPDEFIPMAEDTGLIVQLGREVLRAACGQTVQWRALPGAGDLCVNVNVSSHQMNDDHFVADVEAVLRTTGLPGTSLILELTESALLSDRAQVQQRLSALRHLGVRIAVDDFGTGYSSLAYLRSFAIDFLKIDRAFVRELTDAHGDDQAHAIVRTIINMGHDLALQVTAEGIESHAQLIALRDADCDSGQGFLFAVPTPPHQVPDLIREFRRPALAMP